MEETRQNPLALKIVAALFIIGGVFAIIEVFVSLMNGRLSINFSVLGIFIGPGLLRHRPGWRTCALVFLWIALIFIPLITIIMVNASGPLDFSIFGQKQGHAPKEFALVIGVLLFFLTFWQYRVLTRPDIRSLFIPPPA